jgi:hypothetical protein
LGINFKRNYRKTLRQNKDVTTQNIRKNFRTFGELQYFSLDQRFNQNSSVTLINTNVTNGTFRGCKCNWRII